MLIEKYLEFYKINFELVYCCFERDEFLVWDIIFNYNDYYNYWVVFIEFFEEWLDVYDIEVFNIYNFVLVSGVFVYNSVK